MDLEFACYTRCYLMLLNDHLINFIAAILALSPMELSTLFNQIYYDTLKSELRVITCRQLVIKKQIIMCQSVIEDQYLYRFYTLPINIPFIQTWEG